MRCRLTILALLVLAGAVVVVICPPVGGDADPGIKKEHLDPTPGDLVDDVTIEIDDSNGLQVKAIPADSVLPSNSPSSVKCTNDLRLVVDMAARMR